VAFKYSRVFVEFICGLGLISVLNFLECFTLKMLLF